MLRTRLWMGLILVVLTVGVLVLDEWLAPWYPFLFVLVLLLTLLGCHELLQLLGTAHGPQPLLCYSAVIALVAANWLPILGGWLGSTSIDRDGWFWIASIFAVVVLAAFVVEMSLFQAPGESVARISLAV